MARGESTLANHALVSNRLAKVSQEISIAQTEVDALKNSLSLHSNDRASKAYAGLDPQVVLQLFLSAAQQLDRLREKEIELLRLERCFADPGKWGLRASPAAAGPKLSSPPVPSHPTHVGLDTDSRDHGAHSCAAARKDDGRESSRRCSALAGAEGKVVLSLSDVSTWVSCRSFLDEMGVRNVRFVDAPVPRAELSIVVNDSHRFQWRDDQPVVSEASETKSIAPEIPTKEGPHRRSTSPYRPTCSRVRAGLAAYLNASIRPVAGSEWVIPGRNANEHADFLSVLVLRGNRLPGAAPQAPSESRAGAGTNARYFQGEAPTAALCLSAAVANGTPSGGLRVVLELVPPIPLGASRPTVRAIRGGGAPGVDDQSVLYRAIASLVAANARSPCSKPVVVLTDLQGVWKLMWLGRGGGGSGSEASSSGHPMRDASPTSPNMRGGSGGGGGVAIGGTNSPNVDVFVWRLGAADAVSVLRSILAEESTTWDGEVSAVARGDGVGLGSIWANFRSGGGPMASLRNRYNLHDHHSTAGVDSGGGDTGVRTVSPSPISYMEHLRSGTCFSAQILHGRGQQSGGEMVRERQTSFASAPGRAAAAEGFGGGTSSSFLELLHSGQAVSSIAGEHREHRYSSNGHSSSNDHYEHPYLANGHAANSYAAGPSGMVNRNGFLVPPPVTNPLVYEPTVLQHLIPFVAGDGFLFVAGVCKGWREAWGMSRPQETSLDAAVQSPSRLGWARASGCTWSATVCARAAGGGYFATLRYARAVRCPWDWRTCAQAAAETIMPVNTMIEWAARRTPSPGPAPNSPPMRLEILQWARLNGCPWDESTTSEAARVGNLDVLRWARANGCPWNVLTCAYAAAAGHLDILRWARKEGCPWNEATCAFAAAGGHLEVLKWCRANGCPWGEETCASAARGARLEVLHWARSNGCPWGDGTCANAAEGGHLSVLQWARREGCAWTEATCTLSAKSGHLHVLQWARANGCAWGPATFRAAAARGDRHTLLFLRVEGCPWDRRTCSSAARNGQLETLQWLRAEGCPWDSRTLDEAAKSGSTSVFDWAMDNGCPS